MSRPAVIRTIPALRRALEPWRVKRAAIALVPTMGALHEGHLSLVRLAKSCARRVVVSIFVNPTQFAANEDFGSYPRTLRSDLAALAAAGVDLVWNPSVDVMYPDGFATRIELNGPAQAGLEDAFRPQFFGGVATVVTKLFAQTQPDIAVFGQKDYQQLQVIARMAADLDVPVRIIPGRTIREKDGLAMSSRNAYLGSSERAAAPTLYRTLRACARAVKDGAPVTATLETGRNTIQGAGFALDYLEARHAHTLAPIVSLDEGPVQLLVAARIGRTRLIDNLRV